MGDQFTSVQWDDNSPWNNSPQSVSTQLPLANSMVNSNEESQLLASSSPVKSNSHEEEVHSVADAGAEAAEAESVSAEDANNNNDNTIDNDPVPAHDEEQLNPVSTGIEQDENESILHNTTVELTASKPTFHLKVKVQNPKTHHQNSNVYTIYELQIETDHPKFNAKIFSIYRRYSDFDFLHQCLSLDFPTLLVPPLPNKKRLEYIKGGRFTEEFISKRVHALNLFMERLINHPILSKSEILIIFLNNDDDYWKTYKTNLKLNIKTSSPNSSAPDNILLNSSNSVAQNIEGVTDFIMNSFKKPHVESKFSSNFKDISNESSKLQDNLNKIDKIYSKVVKKQSQIANDLSVFSDEFSKLTILFQNDLNGKFRNDDEVDDETKPIINNFKSFSKNLKQTSSNFLDLNHFIEFQYLNDLKELEHYIFSLDQLIKLKDNKIIDYEVLNSYLEKSINEKSHLENGGSITDSTEGAISYWSRKLESLTGFKSNNNSNANSVDLVNERLNKLNSRIQLLESEKQKSKQIFQRFEQDILNEWNQFQLQKDTEIKESLLSLTNHYQHFYKDCENNWENFNPLDSSNVKLNTKLTKEIHDELYKSNDDVNQMQDEINQGLNKLGIS